MKKYSSQYKSDFLNARAKTAVTIMNASGWKEGLVNTELVSADSVFFYVFDYNSKWTWCCSIPRLAFTEVVKNSLSMQDSSAISFCGQMIDECAIGNGVNPDKEEELALALICYIRITKSYQLTECARKQNHFVVIRYGKTEMIRPFSMIGPNKHLIGADQVISSINTVVAMDTKNHPEWIS